MLPRENFKRSENARRVFTNGCGKKCKKLPLITYKRARKADPARLSFGYKRFDFEATMITSATDALHLCTPLTRKEGESAKTKEVLDRRREALKGMLQKEIYGILPPKPAHLKVALISEQDPRSLTARAVRRELSFLCEIDGEEASFPATQIMPKGEGKFPVFIYLSTDSDGAYKDLPIEQIAMRGYGIFILRYQDVAKDSRDFRFGMAKHLCKSRRALSAPGKIAIWAWAAMRVMDYALTLANADAAHVAVIGQKHLGRSALFCGAMDERFRYVIASTQGGDATGAHAPYWFCPRYKRYADEGKKMTCALDPLLSLIAPRDLLIDSAEMDLGAEIKGEHSPSLCDFFAYMDHIDKKKEKAPVIRPL